MKTFVSFSSGWDDFALPEPSIVGPTLALCGNVLINHVLLGLTLTAQKDVHDGEVFGKYLEKVEKPDKAIVHLSRQGYARMEEIALSDVSDGFQGRNLDNMCFVVEAKIAHSKNTFIVDAYKDSGSIDDIETDMEKEREIDLGRATEIHFPMSWIEGIEPYEDLSKYLVEQEKAEKEEDEEEEKEAEVYV